MNKFGFALALVVAVVGVASANEGHGEFNHLGHPGGIHRGRFEEGGFEGGELGGLGGFRSEVLEEEIERRRLGLGGGVGGIRGGGLRGGLGGAGLRGGAGRLGRRSQFSGVGRSGLGGIGGGLGGAGIGGAGFSNSQGSLGALNAGSSDFESGLAEQKQAGLLAGRKDFDAGQHLNANNENSGLHKHQVLNSDKTIIKDRTTGVNDFDTFSNRNGVSQGSHASGSEAGVAAGASGSKVAGERESDRNVNALNAQGSNTQAGIAGAGVVA